MIATAIMAILLIPGNVNARGLETTIVVEMWMTDEAVWNTNSANHINLALVADESLEVEA